MPAYQSRHHSLRIFNSMSTAGSTPIKQVFAEYIAKYDARSFQQAQQATDKLAKSARNLGGSMGRLGGSGGAGGLSSTTTALLGLGTAGSAGLAGLKGISEYVEKFSPQLQQLAGVIETVRKQGLGNVFADVGYSSIEEATQHFPVLVNQVEDLNKLVATSQKAFKNAADSVRRLGIEILAVVAGVTILYRQMTQLGMEIGTVARRLDIAASSLAGFRQAAVETGLDAARVDDALTDLGEKIGEAVYEPTSESSRAFRRLGISARELRQGNIQDIFLQVADGIQAQTNQQLRLRLANQVLGGSGRALIPVLEGGSEALRQQVAAMALSQPEFEAYIRNSRESYIQNARMEAAWSGLKQVIYNDLAPAIIWLTGKIRQLIELLSNNRWLVTIIEVAFGLLAVQRIWRFVAAIQAVIAAYRTMIGLQGAAATLNASVFGAPAVSRIAAFVATLSSGFYMAIGAVLGFAAVITAATDDFFVFMDGGSSLMETWLSLIYDMRFEFISLIDVVLQLAGAFSLLPGMGGLSTEPARAGLEQMRRQLRRQEQDPNYDPAEARASYVSTTRNMAAGFVNNIAGTSFGQNAAWTAQADQRYLAASQAGRGGNYVAAQARLVGSGISINPVITINEAQDAARTQQIVNDAIMNATRQIFEGNGSDGE